MRDNAIVIGAIMKVGRNEACPCGSRKKYKKCCLVGEEEKSSDRRRVAANVEPPQEGNYVSDDGEVFSVTNVMEAEEEFYTLELVESDDPEDMSAISTDLNLEEWAEVVKRLGLKFIEESS